MDANFLSMKSILKILVINDSTQRIGLRITGLPSKPVFPLFNAVSLEIPFAISADSASYSITHGQIARGGMEGCRIPNWGAVQNSRKSYNTEIIKNMTQKSNELLDKLRGQNKKVKQGR